MVRLGIKPVSCPAKTIIIALHQLSQVSDPTLPRQTPYSLGQDSEDHPLEDQPVLLHSASFQNICWWESLLLFSKDIIYLSVCLSVCLPIIYLPISQLVSRSAALTGTCYLGQTSLELMTPASGSEAVITTLFCS